MEKPSYLSTTFLIGNQYSVKEGVRQSLSLTNYYNGIQYCAESFSLIELNSAHRILLEIIKLVNFENRTESNKKKYIKLLQTGKHNYTINSHLDTWRRIQNLHAGASPPI